MGEDVGVGHVASPEGRIGDGEAAVEAGGGVEVVGDGALGVCGIDKGHSDLVRCKGLWGEAGVVNPGEVDGVAGALGDGGAADVDTGAGRDFEKGEVDGEVDAGALDGAVAVVAADEDVARGLETGGVVAEADADERNEAVDKDAEERDDETGVLLGKGFGVGGLYARADDGLAVADIGCDGTHGTAGGAEKAEIKLRHGDLCFRFWICFDLRSPALKRWSCGRLVLAGWAAASGIFAVLMTVLVFG